VGGKGSHTPSMPPITMPAPPQMPNIPDNTGLIEMMMRNQQQQTQDMMNMFAMMMQSMNQGGSDSQPIIVMPDTSGNQAQSSPTYQAIDFSAERDRQHEKATRNVDDEAANRTGRSATVVSQPRLDTQRPATTRSPSGASSSQGGQGRSTKTYLSDEDEDDDNP